MWQPTCSHNLRKIGRAKLSLDAGVIPAKIYHPDRTLSHPFAINFRLKAVLTILGKQARYLIFSGGRLREGFSILDCLGLDILDGRFEI